jgi:lipoprotein signal peptidase
MIGPFHWPNFNLADCFLVCAAAVFLLYLGRQAKTVSPASEPTDSFEKEGLA